MRGAGELAQIRVINVQFVYVFLEVLDHRECALQVAVPEQPLDPFQGFPQLGALGLIMVGDATERIDERLYLFGHKPKVIVRHWVIGKGHTRLPYLRVDRGLREIFRAPVAGVPYAYDDHRPDLAILYYSRYDLGNAPSYSPKRYRRVE